MKCSLLIGVVMLTASMALGSIRPLGPRRVLSLDGQWQVAEGGMDSVPSPFEHTVVVPGLLDMASPPFADVGKKSAHRQAFWYRRTFKVDGAVPATAILKIHKAMFGTKVILNHQVVGEHMPCFTPGYFDVRNQLKGGGEDNELIVRVGADRDSMPADFPSGWDFEKYLFIPGIYDSVELILTGAPYISNVQTVPDLAGGSVRVVAEIEAAQEQNLGMTASIAQAASGQVVAVSKIDVHVKAGQTSVDVRLPIAAPHLWSPEDPFLYELRLLTGEDGARVRFGMRTFAFDAAAKRAVLNGKPYYLRGTNVTAYRFFEDAQRGDKPWREDWVRRLHRAYKTMHWNSIRYCIGFPPERWYDIADEEGFLIQDEFPIWLLGGAPEKPAAQKIIPQYVEWMRERWNHPCVVIWDGQNESTTEESGKAIAAVRKLDLSGRPWENGWAQPQEAGDCVESHPYLFIRTWSSQGKNPFRISELAQVSPMPQLQEPQKKRPAAILINEYDWLWLTRDGNPTCLTDKVYESLLGKESTVEQRRLLHARYVAALTEFWRCHREAAGVMHFCGLGYSRPGDRPRPEGGATSDDFVDLEKLEFEPHFKENVGEAFNPVGIMLDFWAEELATRGRQTFRVYVINDRETAWAGKVRLTLLTNGKQTLLAERDCSVAGFGREILQFQAALPQVNAAATIGAELTDGARRIRSLRDVQLKAP